MTAGGSQRERIEPDHGLALPLDRGDLLVIVDPEGEQAAEFTCFAADDLTDGLNTGRTIANNASIRIGVDKTLWSRRSRRLMTIVEDTCGVHDILLTPPLGELEESHEAAVAHQGCVRSLSSTLAEHGVQHRDISATFGVFANVAVQPDGKVVPLAAVSVPGTHIVLMAERPVIAAVAACGVKAPRRGAARPIDIEVISQPR